jgi:hypothetical protein
VESPQWDDDARHRHFGMKKEFRCLHLLASSRCWRWKRYRRTRHSVPDYSSAASPSPAFPLPRYSFCPATGHVVGINTHRWNALQGRCRRRQDEHAPWAIDC